MDQHKCSNCKEVFFITLKLEKVLCPFCGGEITSINSRKRKENRHTFSEKCILSNGFGSIAAEIIDISKSGIGISIGLDQLPFKKENFLNMSLADSIKSLPAEVVWISNNKNASRIGMRCNGHNAFFDKTGA